MIKAEFIQTLKQTNISKDGEKTALRLKDTWRNLSKAQREEVLGFSGLKKPSIERAYTNGTISAKIAVSMAQVANVNPLFLTGEVDDASLFGNTSDILTKFLKDLGYKPTKKDTISQPVQEENKLDENDFLSSLPTALPNDTIGMDFVDEEYTVTDLGMISMMAEEISALLNKDAAVKAEALTDVEIALLLQSLSIQSKFSDYKKAQFELVKYLLLL